MRTQILLVGVGGQGALTAAQIVGTAAHAEGLRVVVGQLHGMSQRGGSVEGTVVLGDAESSMLLGEADAVIALEPIEALRALSRIGSSTCVVTSTRAMVPFEFVLAGRQVATPDEILERLRTVAARVHALDAPALAREAGDPRTLNVVMLGAAHRAGVLPVGDAALERAILDRCGPKYREANRRAFELGRAHVG